MRNTWYEWSLTTGTTGLRVVECARGVGAQRMSLEAYHRNNEGSGGRWQVMTKQSGFFELYHRDNRAAGDMGAS